MNGKISILSETVFFKMSLTCSYKQETISLFPPFASKRNGGGGKLKALQSINRKGLIIPFAFTNSSGAASQPCITVLLFPTAERGDLNSAWVAGLSFISFSGALCSSSLHKKYVTELKF